jgi:hypothetical protein
MTLISLSLFLGSCRLFFSSTSTHVTLGIQICKRVYFHLFTFNGMPESPIPIPDYLDPQVTQRCVGDRGKGSKALGIALAPHPHYTELIQLEVLVILILEPQKYLTV